MKRAVILLPALVLVSLAACVSDTHVSWRPLVDIANDKNVGRLTVDYAECQRTAQYTSNSIGGLNQNTPESEQEFKTTYTACMKDRGHPIIAASASTAETPTPVVFAPPGMKVY